MCSVAKSLVCRCDMRLGEVCVESVRAWLRAIQQIGKHGCPDVACHGMPPVSGKVAVSMGFAVASLHLVCSARCGDIAFCLWCCCGWGLARPL